MEIAQLMPHAEALIFASERPITQPELIEMLSAATEQKLDAEAIEACINGIIEKYSADCYPFQLQEVGGGHQFLTKKAFHKTVLQLNGDKHIKKLSAAAMETLAIIAYKQPITKSEIEFIRGVSADYSIQKLLEKELIIISGRNEEMIGKPLVYATSKNFMDYIGINSPAQLPQLRDIANTEIVLPTPGEEAVPEEAIIVEGVTEEVVVEEEILIAEETIVAQEEEEEVKEEIPVQVPANVFILDIEEEEAAEAAASEEEEEEDEEEFLEIDTANELTEDSFPIPIEIDMTMVNEANILKLDLE